ncbi:ATP-binding protein [Bradymonadaceae bacterium TMQ3]|uniref:ATP-binding protein n=1 Tax=Lujinxingia sediminis TaxID=2480984 RepID=A0ABY0CMS8_9DELT|nr:ATP-binding protein [Lujinxingia sediminis]RDV36261.1 ATP-binding protein [Bradymonadaceae bacterium TMQ3]RVU40727.1 ATP-binding protein [Lujinxingia sediminis]TXC67850.1 ATP-binding protein [Bradymonadales bacterium TMQ1]
MLIEFRVSNYRSFRDENVFSLVAAGRDKTHPENTIDDVAQKGFQLLRSAVIYGANASGKTNLLRALDVVRTAVINSAKWQKGDPIEGIAPFRLDAELQSQPGRFEIVFVQDGVRFEYGFVIDRQRVHEEWLFAYPKKVAQTWFQRDASLGDEGWTWGANLKGQKKQIAELTRDNALFLSVAAQLNHEQLSPVFQWFQDHLRPLFNTDFPLSLNTYTTQMAAQSDEHRAKIATFLRAADFGIADIKISRQRFDETEYFKSLPEDLKERFLQLSKDTEHLDVQTLHRTTEGQTVHFSLDDESHGTRSFYALTGRLLDVLENGRILVVDELDTSLHPLLVRKIVELFHSPEFNKKNAQLIFNTHDTSLLDPNLFRRDQIWFTEKDRDGASHLYPLSDFKPRKDEALERGYLAGRYRALPFIGRLEF